MKKASLILGIIFLVLTFAGDMYVLINHGKVNAGYAVIPALWCMICFGFYRSKKGNKFLFVKQNSYIDGDELWNV